MKLALLDGSFRHDLGLACAHLLWGAPGHELPRSTPRPVDLYHDHVTGLSSCDEGKSYVEYLMIAST